MNTKLVMYASAILMGSIGIALSFLPQEVASFVGLADDKLIYMIFQFLGALYFGFAMLNWFAKDSRVGGIYNRPISVANLSHYLIAALALVKLIFNNSDLPIFIWILTAVYVLFTILFAVIFYRNPLAEKA